MTTAVATTVLIPSGSGVASPASGMVAVGVTAGATTTVAVVGRPNGDKRPPEATTKVAYASWVAISSAISVVRKSGVGVNGTPGVAVKVGVGGKKSRGPLINAIPAVPITTKINNSKTTCKRRTVRA